MQWTDGIPNSPRMLPSTGSMCCPQCVPVPQQPAEPKDVTLGILHWLWDFLALPFWVCSSHCTACVGFHWEGRDLSSKHRAVTPSTPTKGRKKPASDRFPAIAWWLKVIIKSYGAMQPLRVLRILSGESLVPPNWKYWCILLLKNACSFGPSFYLWLVRYPCTHKPALAAQTALCTHCRKSLLLPGRSRGWEEPIC